MTATQLTWPIETANSRSNAGRTSWVMLASSWPMKEPIQTVATMIQIIEVPCFEAADAGGSVIPSSSTFCAQNE